MAAGDSGHSSRSSSSSASSASSSFDPNKVLDDFNERLRALNKPVDLSISQETLNANTAMFQGRQLPVAPSTAAARAERRWQMVDVVDVEDISGRTAPAAAPEPWRASEPIDEVLPALADIAAPPVSPRRRSREQLPWVEELDLAAERAEAARLEQEQARAQALAQRVQACQDEAARACQALQQSALRSWAQAGRESLALAQRLRWPVLVKASLPQAQARIAAWRSALGEALVRADSMAEHALKDQQRDLQREARERLARAAASRRLAQEQAERLAQAQVLERALQEAGAAELQRSLQQQIAQARVHHETQVQSLSQEALLAHKKARALSRRRATLVAKKLVKETEAQRAAQALAAERLAQEAKAAEAERQRLAQEEAAAVAAAAQALKQEQERAQRLAAEQAERETAARLAVEQAAAQLAAEQAAQQAAEQALRDAEQQRAEREAEREVDRKAAQQAADRQAAERLAAEVAAREAAERAARLVAELAAEEAAKAAAIEAALARESARLAREAQAERERAELAAFLRIDLKVSEANAGSGSFDLGQIQLPGLSPAQELAAAQPMDLSSLHLPQPAPVAADLDLGDLGDLGQMLAKVAHSSRQATPEPQVLDLHRVADAAQLRHSPPKATLNKST